MSLSIGLSQELGLPRTRCDVNPTTIQPFKCMNLLAFLANPHTCALDSIGLALIELPVASLLLSYW